VTVRVQLSPPLAGPRQAWGTIAWVQQEPLVVGLGKVCEGGAPTVGALECPTVAGLGQA